MKTDGIRAAVLAAMLVLSVAAGVAVTGVMAQQADDRNEIKLELSSTQPHTVTAVTGTGAIDGANVFAPQVPGKDKTGKLKKLIIKSGGGLDFSGLRLIPPPTSGIDRNGDEPGTAIDKNLLPLLANLEQKNNHHTLVITLTKPVKVSVGDEIVISITEKNKVKTGDAGTYTMKVIGVGPNGERAAPATVTYTIGNPQTPTPTATPTQTPDTPTQTPDTPTQTPDTPTQTPDTPTQTPDTPTQTPDTPTQTPDTPTQTPEQPPEQPNKKTLRIEGSGDYAAYTFSVSGDLTLAEEDAEEEINGSTAYGAVGPDSDTYKFTGSLKSLAVAEGATVYVNGEKVDPSSIGSDVNVVTFMGTGSYASYDFSTSGEVVDGIYLDKEDSLSQSSGAVDAGLETYFYTGTLEISPDTNTGNMTVVNTGNMTSAEA